MCFGSTGRTKQEADATHLLDTFCVIHFIVAPIGATLGVLLGFLSTPKALMVYFVGGVSESLHLFPEILRGVRKHSVSCPNAPPMKAHSPIEDLENQVPILMFMKFNFGRFLSEFHL